MKDDHPGRPTDEQATSMTLRNERWPVGLMLVMFVAAAATAPFLPDTLPIHWSNGEADGFASRPVALFLLPLLALAFYSTLALVSRQHEDDDPEHVWWWARTISTGSFAVFYVDMQMRFLGVRLRSDSPVRHRTDRLWMPAIVRPQRTHRCQNEVDAQ